MIHESIDNDHGDNCVIIEWLYGVFDARTTDARQKVCELSCRRQTLQSGWDREMARVPGDAATSIAVDIEEQPISLPVDFTSDKAGKEYPHKMDIPIEVSWEK